MSNALEDESLEITDKKGFQAHVTILKLSRSPKLRKKGKLLIDLYIYVHSGASNAGQLLAGQVPGRSVI